MTRARGRSRRRPPQRNRIEVWRIILWSGLTNLVLLSVFFVAQHLDLHSVADATGPIENDRPMIDPASKTSTVDVVPPKDDFSADTVTVAKTEPEHEAAVAGDVTTQESTADLALAAGASTEDSEKVRAAPILRKSLQDGKLEIGNFKSLSMVGSAKECLDFGDAMLKDAGVVNQKVDVVASAAEITIARICAANGSVIITCRGGQIAVSPRKSRPDDQCARNG